MYLGRLWGGGCQVPYGIHMEPVKKSLLPTDLEDLLVQVGFGRILSEPLSSLTGEGGYEEGVLSLKTGLICFLYLVKAPNLPKDMLPTVG